MEPLKRSAIQQVFLLGRFHQHWSWGILGRATSHLPTWGEATRCNEHKFSTLLDILSYFVDFYRCVGCVIFIFTGAAAFEAGSAGSNPTTTTTTPTYQVVQNHWPLQLNSCSKEKFAMRWLQTDTLLQCKSLMVSLMNSSKLMKQTSHWPLLDPCRNSGWGSILGSLKESVPVESWSVLTVISNDVFFGRPAKEMGLSKTRSYMVLSCHAPFFYLTYM